MRFAISYFHLQYSLRNLNVSNKSLFTRAEQNVEDEVTNYLDIPCSKLV